MKVMISGGMGMIGSALTDDLVRDGHEVIVLTRKIDSIKPLPAHIELVHWDGVTAGDWAARIEEADAVVNLAGESLSAQLWTPTQKRRLVESRVNAGRALSLAIKQAIHKPRVLIQASGVGAYGTSEMMVFDESNGYGDDFLSGVTREWEASTQPVEEMGVRRVVIRSGVVFDAKKGALPNMLLPFKFFVGGRLGTGRQWISWIHLQDEVRAIRFLIGHTDAKGVYNLSAQPVTNSQFAQVVVKVMHRPAIFAVPAFILKLILGEMSTVLLDGQNVSSKKLQDAGFQFLYPKVDSALASIL